MHADRNLNAYANFGGGEGGRLLCHAGFEMCLQRCKIFANFIVRNKACSQ